MATYVACMFFLLRSVTLVLALRTAQKPATGLGVPTSGLALRSGPAARPILRGSGGGVGAPGAPSVSCGTPFSATWRGRLARCYVILAGAEDRRPGQTARGHMTTARVRTGPTLTPAPCPCHR